MNLIKTCKSNVYGLFFLQGFAQPPLAPFSENEKGLFT